MHYKARFYSLLRSILLNLLNPPLRHKTLVETVRH